MSMFRKSRSRAILATLAVLIALFIPGCQGQREESKVPESAPAPAEGSGSDGAGAPAAAPAEEPPPATPAPSKSADERGKAPSKEPARGSAGEPSASQPPAPPPPREPSYTMIAVPEGKGITVILDSALSSKTSRPGEAFTATTKYDVQTRAHPGVIIPAGSTVSGEVVEAQKAKEFKGQAKLVVKFNELRLASGKSIPIVASLGAEGKDTTKRSVGAIAGGAAAGAILGKIIGKDTKGAAIGAVAGAAIGTGVVVGLDNKDVDLPSGTELVIRVDQTFEVPVPEGEA